MLCNMTDLHAPRQLLVTDWNAFLSMEPNGELNEGMVEQIMRPSFNNLSYIEMQCSFNLSSGSQIHSAPFTPDFAMSNNNFIDRNIKSEKRRTMSESAGSFEAEEQKSVSPESVKCSVERVEKKQKSEANPVLSASKSASKQANEISHRPKEEYNHVLVRRGQATNTHSLAERVRREKISERMRALQDLVPGCNKIIGKAVMLDEIINYVESLQRQVEFLSMKLVAINPELNFDIEQLLHPPRGNFPYFHGVEQIQPEVLMTATIPQISSMTEIPNVWDEELQNAIQMGFIPQHPVKDLKFS